MSILLFILLVILILIFLWNVFQKNHTILRTYPLVGYIRYFSETLGVYLRQFFYARDREELPFNRVERTWVYEAAKNLDTTIGFGSTRNRKPIGTIYFVDSPFPLLNRDAVKTRAITIGENCRFPYTTSSLINISAMSYGSISKKAIEALAQGAKMAGCWLNTGEGAA